MSSPNFLSVDIKEHMLLMPSYIGKSESAILEHLNGRLLQYSSELGGVMISYSKPVVLQKYGTIMGDLPHIHFDLTYSSCVLQIPFGVPVDVTVTRTGEDYLTCVYQNCVDIFVPSSLNLQAKLSEGCTTKVIIKEQGTLENETDHVLLGQIVFTEPTTTKTDNSGPSLAIKIEPSHNIISEKDSTPKKKKKRKREESSDDVAADNTTTSPVKKKQKIKIKVEKEEEQNEPVMDTVLVKVEKTKHKKKKRKQCNDE